MMAIPVVCLVKGLLRLYRVALDTSFGLRNVSRRSFDREPSLESVAAPW